MKIYWKRHTAALPGRTAPRSFRGAASELGAGRPTLRPGGEEGRRRRRRKSRRREQPAARTGRRGWPGRRGLLCAPAGAAHTHTDTLPHTHSLTPAARKESIARAAGEQPAPQPRRPRAAPAERRAPRTCGRTAPPPPAGEYGPAEPREREPRKVAESGAGKEGEGGGGRKAAPRCPPPTSFPSLARSGEGHRGGAGNELCGEEGGGGGPWGRARGKFVGFNRGL